MSHTNITTNYGLPQWIGSDKPTFLGDFNSAFNTIDTQMKSNADTAAGAAETASSANATAISANETATAADGKATLAKNTADAATSAAQSASDLATVAKNTADNAAHAALANNISNLAPAYDETRTYSVGELVTYVDENNTGKLYKCIVAWNTPGAFNINYWDDVTATEVFEVKKIRHVIDVSNITFLAAYKLVAQYLNTLSYEEAYGAEILTRGGSDPQVHSDFIINAVNRTPSEPIYVGHSQAAHQNGGQVLAQATYCETDSVVNRHQTTIGTDGNITVTTGDNTIVFDPTSYIEIIYEPHHNI